MHKSQLEVGAVYTVRLGDQVRECKLTSMGASGLVLVSLHSGRTVKRKSAAAIRSLVQSAAERAAVEQPAEQAREQERTSLQAAVAHLDEQAGVQADAQAEAAKPVAERASTEAQLRERRTWLLKPGDVLSHEGTLSAIVAIEQPSPRTYVLKLADGRTVESTRKRKLLAATGSTERFDTPTPKLQPVVSARTEQADAAAALLADALGLDGALLAQAIQAAMRTNEGVGVQAVADKPAKPAKSKPARKRQGKSAAQRKLVQGAATLMRESLTDNDRAKLRAAYDGQLKLKTDMWAYMGNRPSVLDWATLAA